MSIFSFPNPTISKTHAFILTDTVSVKQGDLLLGDPATGFLVAATSASATTVPVGFSAFDYVGDGIHKVEVEFFRPMHLYTFVNDGGSVLFPFTTVHVKDGSSVALAGTCVLGFAVQVTPTRVQVAVGAQLSFTS